MGISNWKKNLTKILSALTLIYHLVKAVLEALNDNPGSEPKKNSK